MKTLTALVFTYALALAALSAQAPPQPQSTGVVNGAATSNTGRKLSSGITIQIRNAAGSVVGSTVTKDDGTFSIAGLSAGTYTLECLNDRKEVIGTEFVRLALPSETENITCATDAAGLLIFNKKALAALGAAAVAIGAVAVVTTRTDGSPAR